MGVVSVVAGALLLLLLVYDVFATVFVPRGGGGPVTRRVYAGVWGLWRRVGDRLSGARRRRFLAAGGPVLLPLTVALWALELVVACALVYLPFAASFPVDGQRDLHPVVVALYTSGFSATTLGVGDVYPQAPALRLLTVLEAGLGFALFSASIAYVLSVYDALLQSSALSLEISRYLGSSEQQDGVDVLVDTVRHDASDELLSWLASTSSQALKATQAAAQYPLASYFHVPDDDRGLPQSMGALLELLTVARTVLDPDRYPELTRGRTVSFAFRSAASNVTDTASGLADTPPAPGDQQRWERHDAARARLASAGVALRPEEESRRDYAEVRSTWDVAHHTLRSHFGYPPRI